MFLVLALSLCSLIAAKVLRFPLEQRIRSYDENRAYVQGLAARASGAEPPRKHRFAGIGHTRESLMARQIPRVPMINYGDLAYVGNITIGTPAQVRVAFVNSKF